MNKIYLTISLLLLLTNCTAPGSAFLSPVITGVKTGSIYQSSLSYGSSKIVNKITSNHFTYNSIKDKLFTNKNPVLPDIPYIIKDPVILLAYKVDYIQISEVTEPEPLP